MIRATEPVMFDWISPQASKGTVATKVPVQSTLAGIEKDPTH